MKRFLLLSFLLIGFNLPGIFANGGYEININIDNYEEEEIILAYYYGDKQLIKDTIQREKKGKFVFKDDLPLEPGIYLLILRPDNVWIQFMVNNENQSFDLSIDAKDLKDVSFNNSKDNDIFNEYIKFLEEKRKSASILEQKLAIADSLGKEDKKSLEKLDKLDNEVREHQKSIVENYPNFITSLLIKANFEIDVPEFEGTEEEIQINR
jgi:hypothetical protein